MSGHTLGSSLAPDGKRAARIRGESRRLQLNLWRWRPQVMKTKPNRKGKRRVPKSVLRLPDLECKFASLSNSQYFLCKRSRRFSFFGGENAEVLRDFPRHSIALGRIGATDTAEIEIRRCLKEGWNERRGTG